MKPASTILQPPSYDHAFWLDQRSLWPNYRKPAKKQ